MDAEYDTTTNITQTYYDRDVFKKDLELKIGHYINVNLWLQARPRRPFPWNDSDLGKSLSYVKKAEHGI